MSEVKTNIKKGSAGLKLAPSRTSMPRFWVGTDESREIIASVLASRKEQAYLVDSENDQVVINAGRKWDDVQTMEVGANYTIIAKVMKPNPEISAAQLEEVEKEFGLQSTVNYRTCLKEGYVQLQLSSIIEE